MTVLSRNSLNANFNSVALLYTAKRKYLIQACNNKIEEQRRRAAHSVTPLLYGALTWVITCLAHGALFGFQRPFLRALLLFWHCSYNTRVGDEEEVLCLCLYISRPGLLRSQFGLKINLLRSTEERQELRRETGLSWKVFADSDSLKKKLARRAKLVSNFTAPACEGPWLWRSLQSTTKSRRNRSDDCQAGVITLN